MVHSLKKEYSLVLPQEMYCSHVSLILFKCIKPDESISADSAPFSQQNNHGKTCTVLQMVVIISWDDVQSNLGS